MKTDELVERLEHFAGLSNGNPICKDAATKIRNLEEDNKRMVATLKMINNGLPRYNWKEVTSLTERLRMMAWMMHAGAAWGFCGEALFLEEAARLLENKDA